MKEYPAIRDKKRPPTHPGVLVREDVLPALGLSVTRTAELLDVSRQALHRVLKADAAVSAEMAVKLGKLCGNGPRLWMRMQAAYDTWHAERSVDTRRIPTLGDMRTPALAFSVPTGTRVWSSRAPAAAMTRRETKTAPTKKRARKTSSTTKSKRRR